jgi:hypothetical protein
VSAGDGLPAGTDRPRTNRLRQRHRGTRKINQTLRPLNRQQQLMELRSDTAFAGAIRQFADRVLQTLHRPPERDPGVLIHH